MRKLSPHEPQTSRSTSRDSGHDQIVAQLRFQDVLDKLADQPLTVWEIWTTVTDQHDSDASYAAVRDYIRSHRQRK